MPPIANPAAEAFAALIDTELEFGQVTVRKSSEGYTLSHSDDVDAPAGELNSVAIGELRELALNTEAGNFRPLKSAPTLRKGWLCSVNHADDLYAALDAIYPGGVCDWHAAVKDPASISHYRDFTNRQTGMYRLTQKLSDAQVTNVAHACCDRKFCLKQRLWTVNGLAADVEGEKSLIPCLEPCALLLEFARKSMRVEQQDKANIELAPDEMEGLKAALKTAITSPSNELREADFGSPENTRRLQLLLNKLNQRPAETD